MLLTSALFLSPPLLLFRKRRYLQWDLSKTLGAKASKTNASPPVLLPAQVLGAPDDLGELLLQKQGRNRHSKLLKSLCCRIATVTMKVRFSGLMQCRTAASQLDPLISPSLIAA